MVGAGGAGRVVTHVQLQIEVGGVLMADDRVAVCPDRNRREVADEVGGFEGVVEHPSKRAGQDRVCAAPSAVVDHNLSCGA